MEKNNGLMAQCTKANILLAKSMVEEFIAGMTVPGIMESGKRIRLRDLEPTLGSMVDSMKANGLIIIWTASVCTPGRMADSTEVNTRMTRSTDTVSTPGQMAEPTPVTGAVVSSMV